MTNFWKKIAFAPRYLLTILILVWLIAMQLSSLAVWVVLVSFVLMILVGLLSYARIQFRPTIQGKTDFEPRFYEGWEFILVLFIWQALVLVIVLVQYPQADYSLLPGWLLLLSALPFPVLVVQYYQTYRWDAERRRRLEKERKPQKSKGKKRKP